MSAVFVVTEYAIIRVRKTKLDALIEGGNLRAKKTRKVIDELDKYISAHSLE